jgi:hypothetical protein
LPPSRDQNKFIKVPNLIDMEANVNVKFTREGMDGSLSFYYLICNLVSKPEWGEISGSLGIPVMKLNLRAGLYQGFRYNKSTIWLSLAATAKPNCLLGLISA